MILKMEFLNIEFLWLLAAIPLLALWYYYTDKYKSNTLNFSNSEAFSDSKSFVVFLEPILRIFRMIALALLIIALARPQVTDMSTRVKNNQGIDIVMAIDVSASMLAKDLKPNRLEALKDVAANFIRSRTTDRIGLVEYAGESYTKTPITSDKSIILKSLSEIEYNTIIEGGTAIGMGLATSVNRIKDSKAISKVVILLTDGVNNSGFIDPLTAAELANEFGIKIYTIGLGTNGMALSPIGIDSRGKFNYVNTKVEIDEKLLNEIADMTGGKYFRATNNSKLKEIYDDIDKLERSDIEEFKYYNVQEKYRIFLLPALILIGLEMILKFTLFRSFI